MIIDWSTWELDPAPWAKHAACAGLPQDVFFPGRGESVAQARAICQDCPVRADCLEYALKWRIQFGIWGGMSERERSRLAHPDRPRRLPSPHGTTSRYARGCRCPLCRRANYEYQTHWRPSSNGSR